MAIRYFIKIDYNGSNYHGWQVQPNAKTVQGEINFALSKLLREEINLVGCGRTDTGVHAQNFYAHFNSAHELLHQNKNLLYKLNRFLKQDILIHSISMMQEGAHTRFDATARTYQYFINLQKDPFNTNFQWTVGVPLDVTQMNKAAVQLFNYTDFTSFSKVDTDTKTNNCKIYKAEWKQEGTLLTFTICADRFLRNMVRAIVGTLVAVGKNKLSVEDFCHIIESKDRCKAGSSAPGNALFLKHISYPYPIE